MSDFTNSGAYADDFLTMNREQQLQYLNSVSDALRTLRKQVLDTQVTDSFIDKSTQAFAVGWQGDLKADIEGSASPTHGQDVTIKTRAVAFYVALDAIGG